MLILFLVIGLIAGVNIGALIMCFFQYSSDKENKKIDKSKRR